MWFKVDDNEFSGISKPDIDASKVHIVITSDTGTVYFDAENTIGNARSLGYAKETWELVPSLWVLFAMVFILIIKLIVG